MSEMPDTLWDLENRLFLGIPYFSGILKSGI